MKKSVSDYIHGYITKHTGDEEKMEELTTFIQTFFEKMDEEYADVRTAFYSELEDFTEEVDEEMLIEIVENLKHRDGSHSGTKWIMEDVKNVAKQYNVQAKIEECGKKFDCMRFWFAMNYVFAVHYSVNRTINGYVDLAIDEYCNKNICFDDLVKRIFEKM